jgi:hypothetical protein
MDEWRRKTLRSYTYPYGRVRSRLGTARLTDGVFQTPIPYGPDDGWGVSLDPSVSVIRPRIGPPCVSLVIFFLKHCVHNSQRLYHTSLRVLVHFHKFLENSTVRVLVTGPMWRTIVGLSTFPWVQFYEESWITETVHIVPVHLVSVLLK